MSLFHLTMLCPSRCNGSAMQQAFISSFTKNTQQVVRHHRRRESSFFHSSTIPFAPFASNRHRKLAAPVAATKKATVSKAANVTSRQQSTPCLVLDEDSDSNTEVASALLSSTATATLPSSPSPLIMEEVDLAPSVELLHPSQLFNGTIPYPKSLSPSAILEFRNCPQSFLFQYLYELKQPTTLVLAKGSMCHEALDKIFDLEPQDRTLEHLQNLFRSSWAEHRKKSKYRILFERTKPSTSATNSSDAAATTATEEESVVEWDVAAEQEWGRSGLQLLQNYYQLEDPRAVDRPNPIKREIWVRADLTVDPTVGVTGSHQAHVNGDSSMSEEVNGDVSAAAETFHVRGIVDRLDMVKVSKSQVALRIVDYKTGKAPNLKYSKAMNAHILSEAFFQLKIYALLLREKNSSSKSSINNSAVTTGSLESTQEDSLELTATAEGVTATVATTTTTTTSTTGGVLDLRMLRLFFLTNEAGHAQYLDLDLGATQEARDLVLQQTHAELSRVWTSIKELVSKQDPKAFVGCTRSFCYCHQCRPRFVPGSVWQPELPF